MEFPPDPPDYISGIYNYCDRWCERCAFTARCRTFAMGQEMEQAAKAGELDGFSHQYYLKELDDCLASALHPADEGGPEEDAPADDIDDTLGPTGFGDEVERELQREAARNHECSAAAFGYMDMVDEWFRVSGVPSERDAQPRAALPAADGGPDDARVKDAVDVIRWFQHLICVKTVRAIKGMLEDEEEGEEELQSDANGSAKVVLLGLDRSIAAWAVMLTAFPLHREATNRMLLHLTVLRRRLEEALPDARRFVRAGFDAEA